MRKQNKCVYFSTSILGFFVLSLNFFLTYLQALPPTAEQLKSSSSRGFWSMNVKSKDGVYLNPENRKEAESQMNTSF